MRDMQQGISVDKIRDIVRAGYDECFNSKLSFVIKNFEGRDVPLVCPGSKGNPRVE